MKRKLLLRLLSLFAAMVFFIGDGMAQQITVSGTVSAANDGSALSGVTVSLQNGSASTISNEKGLYRLTVSSLEGKLIFTYTGMVSQTVDINHRHIINISMEKEDKALTEVVVTAFGIERQKKALGYATQVIKGSDLTEARETNVANSLKGKVAGVFVSSSNTGAGGSSFVNIRGASSLTGNNQPLYVVDGVPIDNQTIGAPDANNSKGQARDYGDGIGNILPDDIESVTVLKGPNAAALYGSRGATGVILITTKKGKAGDKGRVDFNSNATFETINTHPVYQQTWGPGYDNDFSSYSPVTVNGVQAMEFPSWTGGESYGPKFDGSNVVLATWPEAGILKFSPANEDRILKFYNTGATFTNTVGVSGGSEKGNYRISVSDMRNTGIYPTSKLNRQTVNLRAGLNVTSKLYVEGKINYIRQIGKNRPGNGLDINTVQVALTRAPAFLPMDLLKNYKQPNGRANNWTDGRPYNPYWVLNEFLSNDSRDRIIGYVLARYKFNNWLSLQARTGSDFYTDSRFFRIGYGTPTGSYNLRKGQVNNDEIHVKEENSDALLTASGRLSSRFTGSFSVGANHLNRRVESVGYQGNNLNIPGIYTIRNAGLVVPSYSLIRKEINSAFYTGQLGYNDYLFLDVSGRKDWSSTLGANNYGFFYPAFSLSYLFADALHLNGRVLDYGKLRLSYAQAGNDASPYQTQIGYNLSSTSYNGQQFASIRSDVPLVDLKNELTTSFEVGTELRFFNGRLGIDFTYYNAATKNQIVGINVPAATGFNTKLINAGEIRNKGIELLLTGTPVRNKNFNWDVTINFSRNRSKVVSLAPNINSLTLGSVEGATIEARVGQAYGNIIGYQFKRAPDGQIWVNNNTRIFQKADTASILGNIQPDFLAGITNSFTYKGITLSFLIDMRIGGELYSNSKFLQTTGGSGKFTENGDNLIAAGVYMDNSGKFQQNEQVIGRQDYYAQIGWGGISEYFVVPADYVALREISLGYNLGKVLPKTIFRNAKLSAVGRNLFYIYRDPIFKMMGISPEGAYAPTAVAQGFETPGTPATRSVGFNLSFSF
jgi:TonB-linked SusC/RagA family outer membrane protein